MKQQELYEHQLPQKTVKKEDDQVKRALRIVRDFQKDILPDRRNEMELLVAAYEDGYYVGADKNRILRSSLVTNTVDDRVLEEDFLSWSINFTPISGVKPENQQLTKKYITIAFQNFLNDSSLNRTFTGKEGVRFRKSLLGMSYIMPMVKGGKVNFSHVPISNVCVSRYAVDWEEEKEKHIVVVFQEDDYDDFINRMPEEVKKQASKIKWGKMPNFSDSYNKEKMRKTDEQKADYYRDGEWAISIDMQNERMIWFGGPESSVFNVIEGEDFPRGIDGRATNPLFCFIQHFNWKGYFSIGDADRVYQEAFAEEVADNAIMRAMNNATTAIPVLTTNSDNPQLQDDINEAFQITAEGDFGFVVNQADGTSNEIVAKTDVIGGHAGGINEAQAAKNMIASRLVDKKVRLNDLQNRKQSTLGEFKIEEGNEAQAQLGVARRQASEWKRLLEYMWVIWKDLLDETDQDSVYAGETVSINGEEIKAMNIKKGDIATIVKNPRFKPVIEVDEDSGVKPNKQLELQNLYQMAQLYQGSEQGNFFMEKIASTLGYNIPVSKQNEEPAQVPENARQQITQQQQTGAIVGR